MFGFFLFCLDLELFAKIKKAWFLHTRLIYYNSRSKQNKKNPEHRFVDIVRKRVQNFRKKILNFAAVGARQSF